MQTFLIGFIVQVEEYFLKNMWNIFSEQTQNFDVVGLHFDGLQCC